MAFTPKMGTVGWIGLTAGDAMGSYGRYFVIQNPAGAVAAPGS